MSYREHLGYEKIDIYRAPPPQLTGWEKAWLITSRIIFLPLLFWDALKFCMNYLFGGLIGRLVLGAQDGHAEKIEKAWKQSSTQLEKQQKLSATIKQKREKELAGINSDEDLVKNQFSARYVAVQTYDGTELDTLEIKSQKNCPINEQKYLICLGGNGECYESMLPEMKKLAVKLNCNVVGFNHRGVCWSTGQTRSQDNMVTDTIAQVQRLLDDGIEPEKITLKGFSLGGAVATLTAKHFHDRGIKVNLFNDRSFSSLTNLLVGHIRMANWFKNGGHQESGWKKILGWILKPIILLILALTKWTMNALAAYKPIPAIHKEYMVVQSPAKDKKVWGNFITDDWVITPYGTLHAGLAPERKAYKAKLDKEIQLEARKGTFDQNIRRAISLKEERDSLKARKMVAKDKPRAACWADLKENLTIYDAHTKSSKDLIDRYTGRTGEQFFFDFFNRKPLPVEQQTKEILTRTFAAPAA